MQDWILWNMVPKSVSLGNIIDAYSKAGGKVKLKFANDKRKLLWLKK
jgi:dipeptidyl-peptidase-3